MRPISRSFANGPDRLARSRPERRAKRGSPGARATATECRPGTDRAADAMQDRDDPRQRQPDAHQVEIDRARPDDGSLRTGMAEIPSNYLWLPKIGTGWEQRPKADAQPKLYGNRVRPPARCVSQFNRARSDSDGAASCKGRGATRRDDRHKCESRDRPRAAAVPVPRAAALRSSRRRRPRAAFPAP